jgi:hypothetical protein
LRASEHQDEIDVVGGECRHRQLVVDHFDRERDLRMAPPEDGDLARQEVER